jgi:uncharacterized membrane protein
MNDQNFRGSLVHAVLSITDIKNWGFGQLLSATLVVQIAAFLAILLDIQFLRQVIGFLYLSFLPGFLFLKIIRLEKIGLIKYILFSSGMSIAILMLFGLLSSLLYPALDVLKPLSGFPLIVSVFLVTLVLYVVSCLRTRRARAPIGISNLSEQIPKNFKSFRVLAMLVCIPILTIFGVEMLLTSGNNLILLLLVIVTSVIVLCTFSERIVPQVAYPLVVLAIALFLLFHVALVSKYLIGYDVHLEFYLANLTLNRGAWDMTIPQEYNAMLSVTVLPVIYSSFLNLDLNWVFKLVYPLIFSLVPLSLFVAFRKLTSSRIAFLAVFFFMSMDIFFFTMLGLDRQIIGELFFALLILLIVEDKISLPKKTLLFVVFSAGLVVSHYALTYIFVFFVLFAFYTSRFLKRSKSVHPQLLTGGLALGVVAMAFVWYIVVAPSPFDALAATLGRVRESLLTSMGAPGVTGLMPSYYSPLHSVSQYIFYGLQLCIMVGLFGQVFLYKKTNFNKLYLSMSIASFIVLILCIVVPSFAAGLVVSRFYHIAAFLLAPYVVLGIPTFYDLILNFRRYWSTKFTNMHLVDLKVKSAVLFLVSLVLILLFLFQVGFFYEITGDRPSSISLSYQRLHTNPNLAMDIWRAQTPDQDVVSAQWLSEYKSIQSKVYSDKTASIMVVTSYGMSQTVFFSPDTRVGTYDYILSNATLQSAPGSYVYFRTVNVVYGIVEGAYANWNTSAFSPFVADCNEIYSNGASVVYKSR